VLKKTDVNGDKAEPVYEWMKKEQPGLLGMKRIKWNFEKFLIGKDGQVKGRWASTTKPEALKEPILNELNGSPTSTATAAAPKPAETDTAKAEL
jgi:peroxiredoxin